MQSGKFRHRLQWRRRINDHFRSSPELWTNARFSGLFGLSSCKGSSGHQNACKQVD
ncbi:hypothetical protein BJV74DRAFT_789736 [Russula compacta]|nr:hypothetical protein BJV74DRAFT_789736 [Russula compacta]